MNAIKLFYIDTLPDGTERYQSQIYIGRGTADFIKTPEGEFQCYGKTEKGFGFYPYNGSVEKVKNITDMKKQLL